MCKVNIKFKDWSINEWVGEQTGVCVKTDIELMDFEVHGY